MNPLGINLWNWCAGLSEECLGLPEKVARMGFTAVELPMTQPQCRPRWRMRSGTQAGCFIVCGSGPGRDLSSFDSAVRASTMDYLTTCLETAGQLGAGILAGPLYTGGGKRHWLSPDEKKREWMLAVDGLRELARRAEHYGVVLSVEPLNRYRTSVANTAGRCCAWWKKWTRPMWASTSTHITPAWRNGTSAQRWSRCCRRAK